MPADLLERASVLGADAELDLCARAARSGEPASPAAREMSVSGSAVEAMLCAGRGSSSSAVDRRYHHGDVRRNIMRVQHPKGPIPILKILQTNACANDCLYCPMRAGREFRREAFTPDELAGLVDQMHRARMIEGLFLSSGVVGRGEYAMERIIATGEVLRQKYGFTGYLHLKIMPNASDAAIGAALKLANRVSVNLEAPNEQRLAMLAPSKDLERGLLEPLRRVRDMLSHAGRAVSRSTQYVVGAAGETDRELLDTTYLLYRELGLSRVYYSRFNPAPGTPLEDHPPESLEREHRLYQADMLIRDYGFAVDDLPLGADDRLPLDIDPKLAWARAHLDTFPVEVNTADRSALLRVPGIGPRGAERILAARRRGRIRHEVELGRIGVRTGAALPWLTIDGKHAPRQLTLPL